MQYRRGSFDGDSNELLERFAHQATPAAREVQLRDVKPKTKLRRRCPAFHLNQGLFDKSQN